MPPPAITAHIAQPPNILAHLAPQVHLDRQLAQADRQRVQPRLAELRQGRRRVHVVLRQQARQQAVALRRERRLRGQRGGFRGRVGVQGGGESGGGARAEGARGAADAVEGG
ncbi:hypothetical protein FH972_021413 [Carpinus fangiana]|uniref:Uncharacterized protein n=1 Tax=Carpinus fangiana TaxID=176857 RepID=A0A5N6KPU4_9ROSI|nr:hypothetical protein FH972_021413 [Carpinus fangiana]